MFDICQAIFDSKPQNQILGMIFCEESEFEVQISRFWRPEATNSRNPPIWNDFVNQLFFFFPFLISSRVNRSDALLPSRSIFCIPPGHLICTTHMLGHPSNVLWDRAPYRPSIPQCILKPLAWITYRDKKINQYYEQKISRVDIFLICLLLFFYVWMFLWFSGGFWRLYEGPGRFRVECPQKFTKILPQEAQNLSSWKRKATLWVRQSKPVADCSEGMRQSKPMTDCSEWSLQIEPSPQTQCHVHMLAF